MLPFALKAVWFALSLAGLIASWLVLLAFARTTRSYWGPVTFGVGNTLMLGIFCLGMIWKMDPYSMPRGFCYAQVILFGFSSSLIAGVTTSYSIATSYCVAKPKTWGDGSGSVLKWRPIYSIPILLGPGIVLIVQAVVFVKLDAVRPSDDFHCDATNPLWTRFIGYAGAPLVTSLPGIYYSVKAISSLYRTKVHIQRSWRQSSPNGGTTPVKRLSLVPSKKNLSHPLSIPQFHQPPEIAMTDDINFTPIPQRRKKRLTIPFLNRRHSDTPSLPPPTELALDSFPTNDSSAYAFTSNSTTENDADSIVSDSFPTFAPPPAPPSTGRTARQQASEPQSEHGHADFDLVQHQHHHRRDSSNQSHPPSPASVTTTIISIKSKDLPQDTHNLAATINGGVIDYSSSSDKESSIQWRHDNSLNSRAYSVDLEGADGDDLDLELDLKDAGRGRPTFGIPMDDRRTHERDERKPPPPKLPPAVWRILIFQCFVVLVEFFASLSTIIDIASSKNGRPSAFGTQHVALLLVAWGPVFLFGPFEAVRSQLFVLPWRKPS